MAMADRHFVSNLLGAQFHPKIKGLICSDPGFHTTGKEAVMGSLKCFAAGLLRAVATQTTASAQFAVNGAALPVQQAGNVGDGQFCIQEAVNLVLFFSIEVLVHLATTT